jgi:hypothetical protein
VYSEAFQTLCGAAAQINTAVHRAEFELRPALDMNEYLATERAVGSAISPALDTNPRSDTLERY